MTDLKYAKLRARIREKYGTEGEFAKALNTSQVVISRKFNNKVQFNVEEIKKWCELLDIPVESAGIYFFT